MLEEMNKKLDQLSKDLVGMHVRNLLGKKSLKMRTLSDEEKDRIRSLVEDLQAQVQEFVDRVNQKQDETQEEEKNKNTRTTLRDRVNKRKDN